MGSSSSSTSASSSRISRSSCLPDGAGKISLSRRSTTERIFISRKVEPKAQFAELDYKIRTAIDRRRVQVELQESRKQLSDLINFLPDATFAIDLKGRVIVWNRMMEELTGVPPDAVMGTGNLARKLPLYEEKRPPLADYIVHAGEDPQEKYPNLKRNGDKLLPEMYHPPNSRMGRVRISGIPPPPSTM